jgi:TctA family transporter
MEDAFRQSMLSSQGALGIFWHNGLSGTITTLALLMLVWPLLGKLRAMAFGRRAVAS